MRKGRRAALIGVLLGVVLVVAVAGYVAYYGLGSQPAVADGSLLIIGLAEDVDGAQVAAILGIVDLAENSEGSSAPRAIDPTLEVDPAGTSYTLLKDRYPFGGGQAVAEAVSETQGLAELAWVAVPSHVWIDVVDIAGGLEYSVDEPVNAYIDDELTVIGDGTQTLSGTQVHALLVAALLEEANGDLSEIESIGQGVVLIAYRSGLLPAIVEQGDATSSLDAETLQKLLE